MKLSEIKGVEFYLKNGCYCPNEIYSSDGFFYQIFKPDEECKYIGVNEIHHIVICKDQLILFFINKEDNNKIVDSIRYDATENNIEMAVALLNGKNVSEFIKEGRKLNKFKDNHIEKDLKKILSIADAIMVSQK